jgi:hypothetical protein
MMAENDGLDVDLKIIYCLVDINRMAHDIQHRLADPQLPSPWKVKSLVTIYRKNSPT